MATAWQSLEEAAITLGISLRTLHRRIAKNELQTRLESGRREVLVTAPDMPMTMAAESSDTSATPNPSENDEIETTVLALHEDRLRRTDLAILAYQQSVTQVAADARRAHFHSRLGWSVAAVLVVALFLAATWATHSVTKAQADVAHMTQTVRQLSDSADAKAKEAEQLRQSAEAARVAAAKAEGQLDAAHQRIDQLTHEQEALQAKFTVAATPATQPSNASATTQPVAATR
jgi:hypothetical protein